MRVLLAVLTVLTATLFAQTNLPKTYQDEYDAWFKVHSLPPANASPEQRQAFNEEVADATAQWVQHWPDDPRAWLQRLKSLARLKSTPNQQLAEIGDTVLIVAKEHPYKGFRFVPFQTDVAEIWTGRHIRQEQSLEILQEAVREDRRAESDNAFRESPDDSSAETHARQLWKELGGTEEGFNAWISAIARIDRASPSVNQDSLPWTAMNKPLTAFHGTDSHDKVWTIDDLKGKTTLINIWATWCRPCKDELPAVQSIFDQFKDRKDVQVLTVTVDDDFNSTARFAERLRYTFPILTMTSAAVDQMVGVEGVPRTWIVDSTGTVRFEMCGYDRALWPQQVLQQLEAVR